MPKKGQDFCPSLPLVFPVTVSGFWVKEPFRGRPKPVHSDN